jgi:plastocyanin
MTALRYLLPVALLLAAGEARADEVAIRIDNFTFTPAELTVKPGTTVVWLNADDTPHSIVAVSGQFHSPAMDTDEKFSRVFANPGEVDYFCGLHPHMKGKIIVKP